MKEKKKLIILTSVILGVLVVVLGLTYALFTFTRSGTTSELVLGDIWMKYNEYNGISLSNALPGDPYSNYFEFTITGKNTYEEKDIWYDIRLTKGDVPDGKTEENRIEDKYLKFKLVEVNNEVETEILTDKTYDDLTNQTIHVATIPKNTNNYTKTYRLYMVISENLTIGNTEGSISNEEFGNLFGSIKVATTGDFNEKEIPKEPVASDTLKEVLKIRPNSYIEEDGIIYISGKQDDYDSSTTDDIDFNYVWYSGKLWRITAIYPDGTMKMITDGIMTTISYGEDVNFYTNENTTSYMYQWLNQEFLPTLYNYENIIVEDAVWNASPGNEVIATKLPVEGQEEVLVNASVGLLNSYEYYKSYQNTSDDSGYLNVGYYWYLLNPYSTSSSLIWNVHIQGSGDYASPSYADGVRPSIYLQSRVQLEGGVGTESNPYRIKGDKANIEENVTLINTRSSGEYVNFDGGLYRIVGIENETTKLIKADYIKDESSTTLTKDLASTTTFGSSIETGNDDYWDYYLNNTWKSAIDDTYESMLAVGTYYTKYLTGENYKGTACVTVSNTTSIKDCDKTGVSTWSGYVGLPRYGEMFASQTRDYTSSNAKTIWLITPYSSSNIWYVDSFGESYHFRQSFTRGGRPTIHLKSTIAIKSGSGLENDPFVV